MLICVVKINTLLLSEVTTPGDFKPVRVKHTYHNSKQPTVVQL